jgi:NAD(P)-dependent dehydrogenase (short-subunit alcohol dehydrogenase family)
MLELKDRVAVITGAGSGIGRASAAALARQGVKVIAADIDEPGAQETAAAIAAIGGEAVGVRCDVGDDDAFEALRALTHERYGRVDIVMNNVGVISSGKPEEIPIAEWARIFNINLMSVVRSNHAFLPDLIARGEGHIVNTASFAGLYAYAYDRLPYATTKGALVTMSEGLALYLKPKGIGVTCLLPGPVRTSIGKTIKVWGEPLGLRGPGANFQMLDPEVVGDMVVDAIRRNVFFLPTDDQVRDVLQRRAADPDAFLDAQIATF